LALSEQPRNVGTRVTTEARAPVLLVVSLRAIGVITESPDIETHLAARAVMTGAKISADCARDGAVRRIRRGSVFSKCCRRQRRQHKSKRQAQPYDRSLHTDLAVYLWCKFGTSTYTRASQAK